MNVGFVHLGCSKNLVDTEMTVRERIDYLNQKIKPWEKYGGNVW